MVGERVGSETLPPPLMDSLSSPPFAQLSRGADPFDFLLRSKRLTALPWAGYNKGVSGPSPHHHLNMVDLSQFVGKHVVCTLDNKSVLRGVVGKLSYGKRSFNQRGDDLAEYLLEGYCYTKKGEGFINSNIVSIELADPEHQFTGIAQKAPNINLDLFVDQTVLVKFNNGRKHIGKLIKLLNLKGHYYLATIGRAFCQDGAAKCLDKYWSVHEIYGEGAYGIVTKSTFDEPVDPKVEEAKELLCQMTEEQVAKLLESLK